MKEYILQETSSDCGFACLKILLCKYKRDEKYLYIKNKEINCLSFLDIKRIAKENGLILEGVCFEEKNNIYNYKFSIIQIIQEQKKHFAIFISRYHQKIKIFDPSVGIRIIDIQDFEKIFTGYSLISKSKRKHSLFKKVKIIPNSYKYAYIFSLVIDFGFIYLLSYLFKNNFDNIKIIFLFLGGIINIILKITIIQSFYNYFDNKYFNKINTYNYQKIKNIMSLKNDITKYYFNQFNNYFVLLTLMIILLSNGFHYLFLLINVILLLIFRWTFIENKLLLIKERLFLLEEKIKLDVDKKSNYNLLKKSSFLYVLLEITPSILLFVMNFIILILTNYIFLYSSTFYIIFSSFSLFTIYQISSNTVKKARYESLKIKKNISSYLSIDDK